MLVFVAERTGTIRLCHADQRYPLLSLACDGGGINGSLLSSMDWCSLNPNLIGATAGDSWFVWNYKNSSVPLGIKPLSRPFASIFRWCTSVENTFAVASSSHVEICRLSESNEQQIIQQIEGHAVDLCWHPTQPVCLAAMGSHLIHLHLDSS